MTNIPEIHRAVAQKNWDDVVELAKKAKLEEQTARIAEATSNPKEIKIVLTGRNDQEVSYAFPIEAHERLREFDLGFDRGLNYEGQWGYPRIVSSGPRTMTVKAVIS